MSSPGTNCIEIHKKVGETPLEAIEKYRDTHSQLADATLGYAGRLDPMASGLLLVLVNDENKKRKDYERLPKTYEFEVLFGIATDSYDVLGMITDSNNDSVIESAVDNVLNQFVGTFEQEYPPYSSPRVQGKPLFWWARENKLDHITIPSKKIEIYSLVKNELRTVAKNDIAVSILEKVKSVNGQFRQEEIIANWERFFERTDRKEFQVLSCTVECSSGTYVRSLSNEIGKLLHVSALAYSITRTKVGSFML